MVRFKRWGEHYRVDSGRQSLLHTESALVRGAIGSVIADILAVQQETQPVLERYGIRGLQVPALRRPSDETFEEGSKWVETLRRKRNEIKQVHTVRWAVRDKDQLQNIVAKLGRRNDQLWNLVRASEADSVRHCTALLESIKTSQDNGISILGIERQISANPDSLLALSFRLKELQSSSDLAKTARQVPRLAAKQVTVIGSADAAAGLAPGTYSPAGGGMPRDIFVEWKAVDASNPARDKIVERIHALGALLFHSNAVEFRVPTFIGTFDDAAFAERTRGDRRIALVYELPPSTDGLPVSLAALLSDAAATKRRPPLGQRFLLAYRLASALSLFHATNWLHKAIRADNILFASADDVTAPLIAGFQYSRPARDTSLEMRPPGNPEADLYYHPNAHAGWTKLMDIYSLGIVLWEIANWRPAFEERFREMNAEQVSSYLAHELEGERGRVWDGLVGKVYMDVVRRCLKGDFGLRSGADEQEARVLGTKFFLRVIKELEYCKA
ncbi:prion-inhibition propagation domain-containing protein [Cladorrhinum samala]|uniref:Prion-inhibition propagation domain-containing protein n=1 Tax=Cladorrhinum samala TaxID=585594 RepID=A0AAV9I049_9PEZI|nr:prion-inhibition propagation domain-containing protein [Cladorrhinum samala]